MNSNKQGNIGEAQAIAFFLAKGYDVFTAFGTAVSFDLIIHKAGILKRVSVKSTKATHHKSDNSWTVKLTQGRLRKDIPFDNNAIDIVAVYIVPENRVAVYDASSIKAKYNLCIRKQDRSKRKDNINAVRELVI